MTAIAQIGTLRAVGRLIAICPRRPKLNAKTGRTSVDDASRMPPVPCPRTEHQAGAEVPIVAGIGKVPTVSETGRNGLHPGDGLVGPGGTGRHPPHRPAEGLTVTRRVAGRATPMMVVAPG